MVDKKKRAAANNRYNLRTYDQIAVRIPKDLAERFKTTTKERGDSQAAIIKKAIEAYLNT